MELKTFCPICSALWYTWNICSICSKKLKIFRNVTERQSMNYELQKLKMRYIPLCAAGSLSVRKCAKLTGLAPFSVSRLKKRYKQYGASIFIHGNTGRAPANKKYNKNDIVDFYNKNFSGAPFAVVADYYPQGGSYSTIYTALDSAGIMSPKAHKPIREKKLHLPRSERPNEGDLVQIDGSLHDWFMNGHKITLHGAIDDATHKVVALYFCENECLLGYYELLKEILKNTGGLPRAIYSDRSEIFFVTRGATLEEQLAGAEKSTTQWQKTCAQLQIELIAAYSPQAKGRIERLWQTLQGRLPYIFRFLGINTIAAANAFLNDFIIGLNARFAVPAQDSARHWNAPPAGVDFDFLFSVKAEKKTRADGTFIYHGYKFRVLSNRAACVRFTFCLSESFGLKCFLNGHYYDVELCEPLCDVVGDSMPIVEKELIYRYFYADKHSGRAIIRAG